MLFFTIGLGLLAVTSILGVIAVALTFTTWAVDLNIKPNLKITIDVNLEAEEEAYNPRYMTWIDRIAAELACVNFNFDVSVANFFLLGWLSSGTSYILNMVFGDEGIKHEHKQLD